ncbi:MAG: hypothetical protein QM640_02165 [Niabella sp.]
MKKITVILAGFVISCALKAQSPAQAGKLRTIAGNYVSFSIDNLENIYLLSATNQLKKLNANGDSVSVFNDIKKFGEVTLVDISNPVKILLFYKGFSTIAILDGTLTLKNTIDLRRKNLFNVTAVGLSYDGNIWLYDEIAGNLKKMDDEGNVIFQTADFRQLFDRAVMPTRIFDQSQYVYLCDSLQGIYVFDYYGSYKNRIDITRWNHLRIIDKYIYGSGSGNLYRYNITTFKYDEWPLPPVLQGYKQVLFKEKKIFALGPGGLDIFAVQ